MLACWALEIAPVISHTFRVRLSDHLIFHISLDFPSLLSGWRACLNPGIQFTQGVPLGLPLGSPVPMMVGVKYTITTWDMHEQAYITSLLPFPERERSLYMPPHCGALMHGLLLSVK